MELPASAGRVAAAYKGLPEARKDEIIAHLAQLPADRGNAAVTQIIENGGEEAKFVTAIMGKPAPSKGSAPENKSVGAPETK